MQKQEKAMYMIENFGGWILDTRGGLIFGCLLLLGLAGFLGWETWKAPKTVTLSSKEFVCADTEPDGIGARCTVYRRIK